MPPGDDRRARVDALFAEALELPEARRAAFLKRAAADDPSLAPEVEELLRLAADPAPGLAPEALAGSPLWEDLAGSPWPRTAASADQRVGAWRLISELGSGGMGTVWLAERADGQYEQKAALKLLQAGPQAEALVARFERERQILASLDHPHIARLLDGGLTNEGRPWFAMEYVDGEPIDAFCDARTLSVEARLQLFIQVARAVQAAHGSLVVHRDLKPSNILVTRDGYPRLLDFGIAKPLDAPGDPDTATRTLLVLTPEYASPEQVRGEPAMVASDVYQLGLLLYELLTGRRAQRLERPGPAELERMVCERTPPSPGAAVTQGDGTAAARARRTTPQRLRRELRGDLDAIVMKALRKEPDRRYASVAGLVADLERHQIGRPVRARPDTLGYRAAKYVRRHRVGVTAALGAGLLLVSTLVVVATQRLETVQQVALARQMEDLLSETFALPNPRRSPVPLSAKSLADRGVRLVRTRLVESPESRVRLLTRLGVVYNALGYYRESIDVLEEALVTCESLAAPKRVEKGEILEWLAQSLHYASRYPEALERVEQLLTLRTGSSGADHPDTLRARLALGDLLHTTGRLAEAEAVLRDAVGRLRLPGADPDSLARALRDLGNVLRDRGASVESESRYREAIALFGELLGRPDQQVAISEVYYARLLIQTGKLERAEALLVENLATLRRIYDGDHALTGTALRNLGYLRIEQGRYAAAAADLEEALAVLRHWLGDGHAMIPRTLAHQAELAFRQGEPEEAVSIGRDALERFAALGLVEHPAALDARRALGRALVVRGEAAAAARILGEALAIEERQFVPGDARTETTRRALTAAQTR